MELLMLVIKTLTIKYRNNRPEINYDVKHILMQFEENTID